MGWISDTSRTLSRVYHGNSGAFGGVPGGVGSPMVGSREAADRQDAHTVRVHPIGPHPPLRLPRSRGRVDACGSHHDMCLKKQQSGAQGASVCRRSRRRPKPAAASGLRLYRTGSRRSPLCARMGADVVSGCERGAPEGASPQRAGARGGAGGAADVEGQTPPTPSNAESGSRPRL